MNEVDYSAFFYKREKPQREDAPSSIPDPPDPPTSSDGGKRQKKKGLAGKIVMTVTVVFLLFAISVVTADFFLKGGVFKRVFSAFRGAEYEYSFVVTECDARDHAYAQSLLTKQGGGAGYVIAEEDGYFVAYAVFCDRSQGESVAAKNSATYVKNISFSSKNTDYCNKIDEYLRSLTSLLSAYERGDMTEAEASAQTRRIARLAEEQGKGGAELTDAEKDLLFYIAATLANKDYASGTKASFLSDLRYAVCSIAYSFCKVYA